ncbi:MAG TPA: AI-2E family transporter [Alphaproteobacteria bacterium]|jgi:predicted PurR-regulated permease PerM|nr:AI-2E family transporter [Alphaproteobacteria bacterium]
MSPARQGLYWLAAFLVLVLLIVLLRDILLPFVVGLAIAYFLDPVIDRLEAHKLSRPLAATAVTVLFFLLLTVLVLLVAPLLQTQITSLLKELPGMVLSLTERITGLVEAASSQINEQQMEDVRVALRDVTGKLASWLFEALGKIFLSGLALLNLAGLIIITPVVTWYLLRDWDLIVAKVDGYLPRRHADVVHQQLQKIDRTLSAFVRGQAIVCVVLGTSYAIALEIIGLNYGLVVGLIVGVISIIPFIGAIVGLLLSLTFGYLQFGATGELVAVIAVFVIGQMIEGNILTPKLVGDRVGLHAVWVMFALLTGGSLFGFVGVLLAIPIAAVIGVLVRFALSRYLESPTYDSDGPA